MSGKPDGQEGRLQPIPGAKRPKPWHQYQQLFLAADLRWISEAALPATQRFSWAKSNSELWRTERKNDGSFFLIDPEGVIRKKWIIDNPTTTVVYSPPLLKDIEQIIGKKWPVIHCALFA
jgi:hypothetical protein